MMYSPKLSLMSAYRIRNILKANQNKLMIGQEPSNKTEFNLEKILIDLYLEKSRIEPQINQLETLARMHQVLAEQKTMQGIHEIELQIFKILGFSFESD